MCDVFSTVPGTQDVFRMVIVAIIMVLVVRVTAVGVVALGISNEAQQGEGALSWSPRKAKVELFFRPWLFSPHAPNSSC